MSLSSDDDPLNSTPRAALHVASPSVPLPRPPPARVALSPIGSVGGASLDLTSAEERYKLRACLTCLAQVRALLNDIQSNPEPLAVPDEYVPFRSLGAGADTAAPDVLSTPRPLRSSPSRARASAGKPPHFGDADDTFAAADLEDELGASAVGRLEDGRTTALAAVAARAQHDPRLATVQGLLQHVDQLTLVDDGSEHTLSSYPAWLAPQMAQVLGIINSLWPTPARIAANRAAEERSRAFREAMGIADTAPFAEGSAFETFLSSTIQQARKRKERLQELNELKSGEGGGASSTQGGADSDADPFDDGDATPCGVAKPAAAAAAAAADSGDDDPFASPSDSHDERKAAAQRAAHLASLSPRARKAFLHAQANRTRESGSSLKDKTHRPSHTKPFGYASHKKKKIGDPLEPLKPSPLTKKLAAKAPSLLYEPKKIYAVSTSHPLREDQLTDAERRRRKGMLRAQELLESDGEEEKTDEAHHDDELHGGDGEQQHEEEQAAVDDDDPFADPSAPAARSTPARSARATPCSSPSSARQLHSSRSRAGQEEKEQDTSHLHEEALAVQDDGNDSDDDPFAAHDPTAARPAQRVKPSPAAASKPRSRGAPAAAHTPQRSGGGVATQAQKRLASSRSAVKATPTAAAVPPTVKRGKALSPAPATKRRPATATCRSASRPLSPTAASKQAPRSPSAAASSVTQTFQPAPLRPVFDDTLSSWQDVELKLLAMQEEIQEQRGQGQRDAKKEVSEALRQLSESINHGIALGDATPTLSESNDMSTMQFERALQDAFARKNSLRIDSSADLASLAGTAAATPSAAAAELKRHQSALSLSLSMSRSPSTRDVNALLGATLASTQSELHQTQTAAAKLEAEKKELEQALAVLQARDAAHAQSLFQLMDKLNSMGANGSHAVGLTSAQHGKIARQKLRATQRAQLENAAFVEPFGTPVVLSPTGAAAAAAARRQYALGTPQAHGTRSLHAPSPEQIDLEASMEDAFVAGLKTPPAKTSVDEDDPFAEEDQSERKQQERRLLELEQELSVAQSSNAALREKLEASSFQSALLARTAEAQKLFMAQTMVHQSDQDRQREAARTESFLKQHQEDLRTIALTERQMREARDEAKALRSKLEADKHALASQAECLAKEVAAREKEQKRMQAETALLKARLEQMQADQQHEAAAGAKQSTGSSSSSMFPHSFAADGSPLPPVSRDFFSFLTSTFRGDYLKLRHSAPLAHIISMQAQIALAAGAQKDDHEEILFSDYVTKFNRRNAGQPRVLVLTPQAIYLLAGSVQSLELRRRVALRDVAKVSLSRLCTELMVLHHARGEHDVLLTTQKRPEVIYHLQQSYAALSQGCTPLPYDLGERLWVRDRDSRMRDVVVLDSCSFKIGKAFAVEGP